MLPQKNVAIWEKDDCRKTSQLIKESNDLAAVGNLTLESRDLEAQVALVAFLRYDLRIFISAQRKISRISMESMSPTCMQTEGRYVAVTPVKYLTWAMSLTV